MTLTPDPRSLVELNADYFEAQAGRVVWATSEEGGGPDVGISIGLGASKVLWIGERSNREGGGVGLLIYDGEAVVANADLGDYDTTGALLSEHVAPALATITRMTEEVEGMQKTMRDMLEGRAGARAAARATLARSSDGEC